MNIKERWIIASILLLVALFASFDIYNDYFEGVSAWHISIEVLIGLIALAAVFYLIKGRFGLQRTLIKEQRLSEDLKNEALKWKQISKKYLEGLSVEIENQLDRWDLTEAEKEVAFLLVKGLSNKEIASVRNTSVPTVRTQTNSIYLKSGLSGRSELSAFFLEELLLPRNHE